MAIFIIRWHMEILRISVLVSCCASISDFFVSESCMGLWKGATKLFYISGYKFPPYCAGGFLSGLFKCFGLNELDNSSSMEK